MGDTGEGRTSDRGHALTSGRGVAVLPGGERSRGPGASARPASRELARGRRELPVRGPVVAGLPPERMTLLRRRFPQLSVRPFTPDAMQDPPAAAVLLDPVYLEERSPGWLDWAFPAAPVILWTEHTPRGMRAMARSTRLHPVRLLIDGLEDVPDSLESALTSAPRLAHVQRLVEALRVPLEETPTAMRAACLRAIEQPESMFDAEDLARAAHLSRRHLDRLLRKLGIAPAKAVVIGARTWLAHLRVVGEGHSVADAAELLGYLDGKGLVRHVRAVTGAGAPAFRRMGADECLALVTRFMRG